MGRRERTSQGHRESDRGLEAQWRAVKVEGVVSRARGCSRVKEDENWPSDLAMWRSSVALRTVLVK